MLLEKKESFCPLLVMWEEPLWMEKNVMIEAETSFYQQLRSVTLLFAMEIRFRDWENWLRHGTVNVCSD
jgi:hypothetical protein